LLIIVDTYAHKAQINIEIIDKNTNIDKIAKNEKEKTNCPDQSDDFDEDQDNYNQNVIHNHNHLSDAMDKFDNIDDYTLKQVNLDINYSQTQHDEIELKNKQITTWIFFCPISLHAIFDGLSLGLSNDVEGFQAIMVAVIIHKMMDGFAVGMPLYYAKFSFSLTLIMAVVTCLMTPLGILISVFSTSKERGESLFLAEGII